MGSPECLGRKELSSGPPSSGKEGLWRLIKGMNMTVRRGTAAPHVMETVSSQGTCTLAPGPYKRDEQEARSGSPETWSHFLLLLVTGIGEGISPYDFITGTWIIVVQGSILGICCRMALFYKWIKRSQDNPNKLSKVIPNRAPCQTHTHWGKLESGT